MPAKRIYRLGLVIFTTVILVAAILMSLRMKSVQRWLLNRYLAGIEKRYDGRLSVGGVFIRWPHRIELTDLLVLDPLNDTLLHSKSILLSLNRLDLDNKKLDLRRVTIMDPTVRLLELPSGQMNYEQLLEALGGDGGADSSRPFSIEINRLLIRDGLVQYREFGRIVRPGYVNWDDVSLTAIELDVKDIQIEGSSVSADIGLLSFQEQSGFSVNRLSAGITVDSTRIAAKDLELLTGNSQIRIARASVEGFGSSDPGIDHLNLDLVILPDTYLHPEDVSLLTGMDTGLDAPLEISGIFSGSPRMGSLQNGRLKWTDHLYFDGDLDYRYPGTLQEAFINLKTRSLSLNIRSIAEEVLSGQIPGLELTIPEPVKKMEVVEYNGLFTGSVENFITTGEWLLGGMEIATNLQVNRNLTTSGYNFKGSVASVEFEPDQWLEQPTGLSDLSFNIEVDGVWDGKKSIAALLIGEIEQFTVNGYTYRNLGINGLATEKRFDGSLSLQDPNARVDLNGLFDFAGEKPALNFDLAVQQADLYALNLIKTDTVALLNVNLQGSFTGKEMDDVDGTIQVENSSYTNSYGTLPVNLITLSSIPELGRRKVILSSDYVDARLVGSIYMDDLVAQVRSLLARFIPALTRTQPVQPDRLNDFAFNIQVKNAAPVTSVLLPGFQCKDNTRLGGFYKAADQTIYIEGTSPQFVTAGGQFTGFDLRIQSAGDSLLLKGTVDRIQLDRSTIFESVNLEASLSENTLGSALTWKSNPVTGSYGKISCLGVMSQTDDGKIRGDFGFPAAIFVFADTLWNIDPFRVKAEPDQLTVDRFRISRGEESMQVAGRISPDPADTLFINFDRVNLKHLSRITRAEDLVLGGKISGDARFFDLKRKGIFLTEASIDSLTINGHSMGLATLSSRSGGAGEPLAMEVLVQRGAIRTLHLEGEYNPVNDSLDFNLAVDKLRMDIANPFVSPDLQDVRGLATGRVRIGGTSKAPAVQGNIMMQKASFVVDYLNTRFYFTHNVVVTPDAFSIQKMDMQDDEGNHATVSGAVRHSNFHNIRLDFDVDFKDFVLLNEIESRNMGYWGRGYTTGVGTLRGPLRNLVIDVSARTGPRTKFYIPVFTTDEARKVDFVTYLEKPTEEADQDLVDFSVEGPKGYEVNLYGATVNIDLEVTPEAEVQLIFDSKVGDVIQARGSGNLRIFVPPTARWTLSGDYTIDQGNYQFTLQNMPVKRLQIEPGATLKWTGEVANAQVDIDAVYRTKAALYDLLQDESNPDLTQRLPVECHLLMSGFLQAPSVDFNIVLPPTSNDIARTQLQNLSKEDLNKQVISLLILNRFTPLQGTGSGTSRGYENAGLATTTEVLSNQLNYWLSQITNDFDVGFNYRPGDQLTSDEVEVALSKQFLNNRMTININGNYDVRPTTANTNQLVGDVEVEYKIKQSGKVRVKAFTRANDHLLYEYAPYTQGLGLFYREEFDTFGDLARRYRDKWFRK